MSASDPILLLDVLGTLSHDPFYEEMPAWFGMTLRELLDAKEPEAWPEFERGEIDGTYEEAFREVLLASPEGSFAAEDVSGIPWIEIDFPEDLRKAREQVFPRI